MTAAATVLLLLVGAAGAVLGEVAIAEGEQTVPESTNPNIRVLEIRTNVRYRYARTEVFCWIANPANESQEVTFRAVLPEAAFISGLAITQNGVVSHARVETRQRARETYAAAVQAGQTAARAEESARNARLFEVALNVAGRSKATFNLTYEQLLSREAGRYRLRHMLDPGQVVEQLLVEVRIQDSLPLSLVRAASLRAMDNEVDSNADGPDDPLARVERPSPEEAVVRWRPDATAQRSLGDSGTGLHGLLEIQYEVEHAAGTTELVVGDGGYFVHFFSPPESELPLLPKHVVFVLDTSGSMYNTKIQQLKEAMTAILRELRSNDTFSLVFFSSEAHVWSPTRGLVRFRDIESLPEDAVAPTSFILEALTAVNATVASGGTNMWEALMAAFALVRAGWAADSGHFPLLFFLTDGEPNGPEFNSHRELQAAVANEHRHPRAAPLYSLAFGQGADFAFLKRLSLKGKGFARRVYEAADAALQMRNFYTSVASPLLANVTFQYADGKVENNSLTRTVFPVHMAGSELAVAGRLRTQRRPAAAMTEEPAEGHGEVSLGQGETTNQQQAVDEAYNDVLTAPVDAESMQNQVISYPAVSRQLPQNSAPFMERVWAYLTVRQLLELAHGDDAEARQRAESLALHYSFVTPVTSLVAVAPAGGEARSQLRDVKPGRDRPAARGLHGLRAPVSIHQASILMAPPNMRTHRGRMKTSGASQDMGVPGRSPWSNGSPTDLQVLSSDDRMYQSMGAPRDTLSSRLNSSTNTQNPHQRGVPGSHPLSNGSPTGVTDMPSDNQQMYQSTSAPRDTSSSRLNSSTNTQSPHQRVSLSRVQWLYDGITGNGTHIVLTLEGRQQVYLVGEPQGMNATTPAECEVTLGNVVYPTSRCVPLPRCVMIEFVDSINNYLPFFCAIGEYAGTCCIG